MSLDEMAGTLLALLDAPSVAFAVLDADRRYTRVSPLFAAAFGATVEDHLGRRPEHVAAAYATPIVRAIARAWEQGAPVLGVEIDIAGVALRVSAYPISSGGRALGTALIAADPVEPVRIPSAEPRFAEIVESAKSRFVDVLPADLDAEIDRSIARLGEALGADHVIAIELDGERARRCAEWAREPAREPDRTWPRPISALTWSPEDLASAGVLVQGAETPGAPLRAIVRLRPGVAPRGAVE